MKIEIHHHHHHYLDTDAERRLIQGITQALKPQMEKLAMLLDTLAADVEAETNAATALETVLDTVAQELKDLQARSGNTINPDDLKAITDKIEAKTAEIVQKTLANTPASNQTAA